ncbi:MAG: single-stranded DNA-binding protein [Bacteroidota bacterium]
MINKVTLIGNLGQDPEVRRLENGAVVARFSIATNENYKDRNGEWQTQTEWHDVVAWRYLAEKAERELKKGKLVFIEGKLTHRKWQDKDGNNRKNTEVVPVVIKLLERRENAGGMSGGAFPAATDEPPMAYDVKKTDAPQQTATMTAPQTPVAEEDPAADDLPF